MGDEGGLLEWQELGGRPARPVKRHAVGERVAHVRDANGKSVSLTLSL